MIEVVKNRWSHRHCDKSAAFAAAFFITTTTTIATTTATTTASATIWRHAAGRNSETQTMSQFMVDWHTVCIILSAGRKPAERRQAMIQTVTFSDFEDQIRAVLKYRDAEDQFTFQGLMALFEYLENLEKEIGEQIEFYPVDIVASFREYSTPEEAASEFGWTPATGEDALAWLEDRTAVIRVPNTDRVIVEWC